MPLFLIANWKYILIGILVLWLGFTKLELANLRAEYAEATVKATEAARIKDAENTRIAIEIDKANLERNDAISKAAAVERDLNRTRGMYVRVKSSCVPGASTDPGNSPEGTVEARLSEGDGEFLTTFAADCARDQGVALDASSWAMSVGKK